MKKYYVDFIRMMNIPTAYYLPDEVEVEIKRMNDELDRRKNLLEDVVNTLDLPGLATEKHGSLGTLPSELVEEVLYEKNLEISTLHTEIERISEVLYKIAFPIKHLQSEAKRTGAVLDGSMAISLSNDPEYLRGIARDALPSEEK